MNEWKQLLGVDPVTARFVFTGTYWTHSDWPLIAERLDLPGVTDDT